MNKIWIVIMLASSTILLFVNPSATLTSIFDASSSSVSLCISLFSVYAVWLGLLEILEQTGLNSKLAKVLGPLINKLFKDASPETKKQIAINMSANILGLGNAATPSGIKAMNGLYDGKTVANSSMITLMIINCVSIQLFPTTTIALRTAEGSKSPADIVLPTIIVSVITFVIGVSLVKLCAKVFKGKEEKNGNC